jgi:hypothetical protein
LHWDLDIATLAVQGVAQLQSGFPLQNFTVLFCLHTEVKTAVSVGDLTLIVRGVKCTVLIKNWPTFPG